MRTYDEILELYVPDLASRFGTVVSDNGFCDRCFGEIRPGERFTSWTPRPASATSTRDATICERCDAQLMRRLNGTVFG